MRYHNPVPTYYVENFGCRATQADGAALERQFLARGLARAAAHQADLVILNSSTVTNAADQDARAAIRRVQRQNPQAKIIVTGCYAQRAPEEVAALPGVSCVVGNSHKHQLAEIVLPALSEFGRGVSRAAGTAFVPLTSLTAEARLFVSDIFAHTELLAAPVFEYSDAAASQENDRTRPNLKVQDGCDNRCSFCVIPSVRGHSRSLPQLDILREVAALVAAGYKELVISGINLGRWGRDLEVGGRPSLIDGEPKRASNRERPTTNDQRLASLIRTILDQTSLEKLRI